MKFHLSAALVVLSAISGVVTAAPANSNNRIEARTCKNKKPKDDAKCKCGTDVVNELVFDTPIKTFLTKEKSKDPSCCDWSTDGCSVAPEKPGGFNFHSSCLRHDFAYRNFKRLDKFTDEERKKIDDNFKNDLNDECAKQGDDEKECKTLAEVYYLAVRACGGGDCNPLMHLFDH